MKIHLLSVILCINTVILLNAQKYSSPFKAGVTAGLNMSQVDGDLQYGYQKRTVSFGLRGGIILNRKLELVTELLYNTKGAKPTGVELNNKRWQIYLDLKYAEVPFLIKYYFGTNDEGEHAWDVYSGLSYGRLLSSKTRITKNNLFTDTTEIKVVNQIGYKSSDLSLIFGISRYFGSRFALSVRHTVALNTFYYDAAQAVPKPNTSSLVQTTGYESFRNFFFSVNLAYDFVSPKIVKKKLRKKAIITD